MPCLLEVAGSKFFLGIYYLIVCSALWLLISACNLMLGPTSTSYVDRHTNMTDFRADITVSINVTTANGTGGKKKEKKGREKRLNSELLWARVLVKRTSHWCVRG